jgi:hypothetical protein
LVTAHNIYTIFIQIFASHRFRERREGESPSNRYFGGSANEECSFAGTSFYVST